MLGSRLLVSALLIPSFIGLCYADHQMGESATILLGLCLFLAIRSSFEFVDLLKVRSMNPSFALIAAGSASIIASLWVMRAKMVIGGGWLSLWALGLPAFVFSLVVLAVMMYEATRYESPGKSMESIGANLLGVSYIGVLLTLTAQLRWVAGAQAGYFVLASLVACVKLGDVGAYTFGRLWGKSKMAPVLSPGKTWMGFVGAIVGSVLGAVLWLRFGIVLFSEEWVPAPLAPCIFYGLVVGLVGLVGDLCESLIKRDVKKKDAAKLMPGFGGLLDLLDSIIFAGPVAYLLWMLLPLATWLG